MEIEATVRAGLNPGFYRILPDLSVDEQDLETKLRREPGVVLVIHYFGFPQPGIRRIAELCERTGNVLVEDCAHALYSQAGETPLGDFAPLAVFSLRKTLPVFDGGALKVGAALQKAFPEPPSLRPPFAAYKQASRRFARLALPLALSSLYRRLEGKGRDGTAAGRSQPVTADTPEDYGSRLSRLSAGIMASSDPAAEAAARRANWRALHTGLAGRNGSQPVFGALAEGVCPLTFCLREDRRDEFRVFLAARGIETHRFGAYAHYLVPPRESASVAVLRDTLIGLPVHGGLSAEQVAYIIRVVRDWQHRPHRETRSSRPSV